MLNFIRIHPLNVEIFLSVGCPHLNFVVLKFSANIHGPKRMNPSYFGDPLTFSSSTNMRLTFMVLSEMFG